MDERPYKTYRSGPRGLREMLRPEEDAAAHDHARPDYEVHRAGGRGWAARLGLGSGLGRGPGRAGGRKVRGPLTWRRGLAILAALIVFWVGLSAILFLLSAGPDSASLPDSAQAALTGGSNMLTGTDTVLIIGTDQRPTTTHERGANTRDTGSRSDTLMLWRLGAGTSRRLSIPRDTAVQIPGHGLQKINAAYAFGGPALTVKTVERFTGLQINHLIIVNLAAFPKFIDAIGGVDVRTNRVCSSISGGARNGGWTLNLRPGVHHLSGIDALVLARTRENRCNLAENDLTREGRQQAILNAVKGKLASVSTLFHLPWAAYDAPQVLRTDMGGPTLLSLFAAAELGGSAPVKVLKPTGGTRLPDGEDALVASPGRVRADVQQLLNG